ncbi:NBR1-Ig-like domain-containing protein [Nonomuraea sp. NPDC049709]|uniref:NBR1-Ig-like domain-containing protein n=1 Tax=Nonomuraea sp. NPDC049709 TaxID=3154736 RepID=UPI00341BCDA7
MAAWIGVAGAIGSAVIAGVFALLSGADQPPPAPAPAPAAAVAVASQSLISGDDMKTTADPTLQDGTRLAAGAKVTKMWLVRNKGDVNWRNRYVQRVGDDPCVSSERRVPVPDADPGDTVAVSVPITVGHNSAGRCVVSWMMVDAQGRILFPRKINPPPKNGNLWLDIEVFPAK